MSSAAWEWLGMAISMVEHEVLNSGRSHDRVRRMFWHNREQFDKGFKRMVTTVTRIRQREQAMARAKAAEQRETEIAQSIAEANAKGVTP